MRFAPIRGAVAGLAATALLGAWAVPSGAQDAPEITIAYAATSDGTGVRVLGTSDPEAEEPQFVRGGGVTHAEIESTPAASGSGQVVIGDDETRAETSAPPADSDTATSEGTGPPPAGPLTLMFGAGEASSTSDAEPLPT
ncbi:MAG: hypothetical protein M3245_01340, partial [Actinomycetota bacterium]|nr:hypothetical protein [Actinomycetota bacterium]